MGAFRTIGILAFSAVVIYSGIFALVWRSELAGGPIPGLVLLLTGFGILGAIFRARYRAAKGQQSSVEYQP